jgi:hypothetical protein
MSGKKADGAEIWIANELDNLPQTFSITQEIWSSMQRSL